MNDLEISKLRLFIVCYVYVLMNVEVRRQPTKVSSCFPHMWVRGLDSGYRTWQKDPKATEIIHQPWFLVSIEMLWLMVKYKFTGKSSELKVR